jgi:sugar phosphate isomerase/epimerase
MNMKLGISSYSFTWAVGVPGHNPPAPMTAPELLARAKHLGVGLLQIADNMPMHLMGETLIKEISEKASSEGIELEVGANKMTPYAIEKYTLIAEKINSKILRFVIDGDGYAPRVKEIISIIKDAEPELKKKKIILALENHDRLFTHEFVDIIEKVGSNYVGICLDCANSLGAGEGFHEVVRMLAPYAVNFHLKEVLIKRKFHKMGFDIEGKPFGEGALPLEWMLAQLTEKCRTAILEQWTPPEETIGATIEKEQNWAERSITYLRQYIKD